jgi:hypothetical protein
MASSFCANIAYAARENTARAAITNAGRATASSLPTSIREQIQHSRTLRETHLHMNPTNVRAIWIKSKHLFVTAGLRGKNIK